MKDAYSFDRDEEGLDKNYQAMHQAYNRIFKRCGLEILITEADPGVMGGKVSHEFMVPAESGEDLVAVCPKCKFAKTFDESKKESCPKCKVGLEKINTIEVGHIFKLGTKYSAVLGADFLDQKGKQRPIVMGCYGIGVSRLISAAVEQNHDAEGIIWPSQIAPYQVLVLPLDVTDNKLMQLALDIYSQLQDNGIQVLLDDRDERAGVKFKDADLIGVPISIVVGQRSLSEKKVEIKTRRDKQTLSLNKEDILQELRRKIA
jgi:prolyl-tRNA synthetase